MNLNAFSIAGRKQRLLKKILLVMKLTTFILFLGLLQCSASAFSQKISLNETNVPLQKVLKSINKQTGYVFFYDSKDVRDKNVSVNVKDAALDEVLNACLKNLSLTYKLVNKNVLLQEKDAQITASAAAIVAIPVSGQVFDEKNNPLPGVTVKLKGANGAAITDIDGKFKLDVLDNKAILVFSYIGFTTVELPVGSGPIAVHLQPDLSKLSEVVVVGYGTQKKVNLTGSIATVSSDKLENRPMVNLGDGLQGLIPNLNVSLGGGQPGTAATFNVRGGTTLSLDNGDTPTAPLVLIDGVARDPNLIDPNDVASVTVLKDAASAAIYGGRAANGVILITTKSGKAGPTKVSYSGYYTISRPTRLVQQVNSVDYIKMFNEANRTGLKSGGYSTTPFTALDSTMATAYFNDPAHNPAGYPDPSTAGSANQKYRYVGNTDWTKVLYPGWAPQQQHNISVSGGEGKTTFLTSLGYFRQDGLEKSANQVYQRYTPTLKVNSDVAKWLTLGLNMSMTHTDNNQPAQTRINQGGAWLYSNIPPVMPVYNPDGNFSGQGNYTNPLAVNALSGRDVDSQNDFWTTGRVVIRPIDHLSVNVDYTWNALNDNRKANLIPFKAL